MSAEQGNVQPWREQIERAERGLRAARDTPHTRPDELDFVRKELAPDGLRALDALTTQIEELERERDEARANADGMARAPYGEFDKMRSRAEKAERALAEIVKFEGAVEGDESDQADALVEVSRIARAALRPSEAPRQTQKDDKLEFWNGTRPSDSVSLTFHHVFARCPECNNATVGLGKPYGINHTADCQAPAALALRPEDTSDES